MARSTNMGLNIWPRIKDVFDHEQLTQNWARIDAHDHTGGRGVQIPTEGFEDGSITPAKLTTAVELDPILVANRWQKLRFGSNNYPAAASGSLGLSPRGGASNGTAISTTFYFDYNDYEIFGLTSQIRIRAGIWTNSVDPGPITFTVGLSYNPTFSGASGSRIEFASFGSGVFSTTFSQDFSGLMSYTQVTSAYAANLTTPGLHTLYCYPSAATAANAVVGVSAELQLRWV